MPAVMVIGFTVMQNFAVFFSWGSW